MGGGGYSFVINNNGHILFHPALKPIVSVEYDKIFKGDKNIKAQAPSCLTLLNMIQGVPKKVFRCLKLSEYT